MWKWTPYNDDKNSFYPTSGVRGAGGRVTPRDFWSGNFCWPTRKKKERKKWKMRENGEEKKENCKREGGKLKMEGGKSSKMRRGPFFFLSNGKKHFTPGKKSGKMTLPPQKNVNIMPLYPTVMSLVPCCFVGVPYISLQYFEFHFPQLLWHIVFLSFYRPMLNNLTTNCDDFKHLKHLTDQGGS